MRFCCGVKRSTSSWTSYSYFRLTVSRRRLEKYLFAAERFQECKSLGTVKINHLSCSRSNGFDDVHAAVMILSGCVTRKKSNYTLVKDADIPNIGNVPQRSTKKPAQGWGDHNDDTLKNVATLPHSKSGTKQ
ncbi:unnamed protein product [Cercopithifilaria johnstoni]|uniref:Uncharacterized protein n=1 Tax=Cercopithifilaria johnstoni TaxID=2874296 RepID=A0A8J2MAU0_9BILA|nr:unnamed protein product [Cercopithifilaria johnstoni]